MLRPDFRPIAALICILVTAAPSFSRAAPPLPTINTIPSATPTTPSAPPALGAKIRDPDYACKRRILYQGRPLPCDSHTRLDGEGLRPIVSSHAESLSYLDRYQRNRKKLKWLPYLGTSAILLVGAGAIIGKKGDGPWAISTRNIMAISGIAIFAGGLGYGLIMLTVNERNLKTSIKKFNEAHPNDPIEIQVQTRFFL